MLEQFHYDSDLIGGSLMVRESRLIADLLLREAIPEQWHQAIQIDNILQKERLLQPNVTPLPFVSVLSA